MAGQEKGRFLEPDYAEAFRCDGQRCGARCCRHWGIYVDEVTYGRYLALGQEEREWVLSHIEEDLPAEEQAKGPLYRARLDFELTESCPFLREDELCSLQRRLGEGYLGDTCALYPRHIVRIGPYLERSLSLSCPVAAELALLRKEMPRLVERELPLERQAGWTVTACGPGEEGMAEAFLLLQLMSWHILSAQGLALPERLQLLLRALEEADEAVEAGDFEALQQVSDRYGQPRAGAAGQEADWPLLPGEALSSLQAALAPAEGANQHTVGTEPMATACALPPKEHLLENYVLAELYIGFYPCRLGGSLKHNGEVLYALAALAEQAVAEAYVSGSAAGALAACVRLSTLANHDQDWLKALSGWAKENAGKFRIETKGA